MPNKTQPSKHAYASTFKEHDNPFIGTSKKNINNSEKASPIIPVTIVPYNLLFMPYFNAAAEVYPKPIAAPNEDISTIHPKTVLPKNGAIIDINIIKTMELEGV